MNWFVFIVCIVAVVFSALGSLLNNREAGRYFTHLGITILAILIAVYGGMNW